MDILNKILGNPLRCLAGNRLKQWDTFLVEGEFTYNRTMIRLTRLSPFQIVYAGSLKGVTNLFDLLLKIQRSDDVEAFAKHVSEIHA